MPAAQSLQSLPAADSPVLAGTKENIWSVVYRNYWFRVDQMFRSAEYGPLVNAANDGAAATAGVPINGLYRNGSVVMIRVT